MGEHDTLTICTVSFHSRRWLEVNRSLTARLNGASRIRWLVAENSPADSDARVADEGALFTVIPGAQFTTMPYASGSYHHGAGMNKLLDHISTRFAMFLDPDFFIIRENWVGDVVEHMRRRGLAILGAPWHPRWYLKPRYFPCAHCMCVDLARLPVAELDFTPDYRVVPPYRDRNEDGTEIERGAWEGVVRTLDRWALGRRRYIGTSRDVSWRIYERISGDRTHLTECLQPVFHPERHGRKQLMEHYLPDRWSFIPKKAHYFTESGFVDRGLPDLERLGWEEFVWRDRPFGFHIRSQPKASGTDGSSDHMAHHYMRLVEVLRSLPAGWRP
jgi:hypothetical protein